MKRIAWKLTLPYVNELASGILLYEMAQETQTEALYQPRGVG